MPIQTDSELEQEIDRAYARGRSPFKNLFSSFLNQHDDLLRTYNGLDPVEVYDATRRPNVLFKKLHLYIVNIDTDAENLESEGTISHSEFRWVSPVDPLTDQVIEQKLNEWVAQGAASADYHRDSNFELLEWNQPSVLAFAINLPSWRFFDNTRRSAMQVPDGTSNGTRYHPNATFLGSRFKTLNNGWKVLLVRNYHLHPDGTPRPRNPPQPLPHEHYKLDLYFRVDWRRNDGNLDAVTVTIDPGGRNLGP